MKKILFLTMICLAACGQSDYSNMTCGDYEVKYNMSKDGEKLSTVINGEDLELNIAISGSGVRYIGDLNGTLITLWNKGEDWTMYLNEGEPISCIIK